MTWWLLVGPAHADILETLAYIKDNPGELFEEMADSVTDGRAGEALIAMATGGHADAEDLAEVVPDEVRSSPTSPRWPRPTRS